MFIKHVAIDLVLQIFGVYAVVDPTVRYVELTYSDVNSKILAHLRKRS